MTKYKLFPDEDYDFGLIGICSNYSDYRLSWNINQCLKIALSKAADYSLLSKKDGESYHSFYEFIDPDLKAEYYLIKNLSNSFKHLIPEKDQIDYFLVIKNNFAVETEEILAQLKTNESIQTAFIYNPDELKSKSNLLF